MSATCVHVGVDVGGTNTDAVVLTDDLIVGWSKHVTTADVTTGVCGAIGSALEHARKQIGEDSLNILRVHIGTTHFVNAVVQRKHLAKVSVVRLCGPASLDLPPFSDFPEDLKQVICGSVHLIDGGFEFDGKQEIKPINQNQVIDVIAQLKVEQCLNVMISGIFSPVNPSQEKTVRDIFIDHYPEASLTLSSEMGQIGLLERENAAVLNECLKPLSLQTMTALRTALDTLGLTCPFYLTQNDGTLISAEMSIAQPVLTFASGPTNSMRGAAFLSGLKNAVVVDIGGTTTDVGVLIGGFPKQASYKVKVGNVRTNFMMPDVLSIGLGGGSMVKTAEKEGQLHVKVGPESVGYRLERESLVFGGSTVVSSDLAVAAGLAQMGDCEKLTQHGLTSESEVVMLGLQQIRQMIEDSIDQVKTSAEEVPLVLVGGGSVLISETTPLKGTSQVYKPTNFQVANAVGAALSQVSGSVDYTMDLSEVTREEAIAQAKSKAVQAALEAGADKETIEIYEVMEVPLAYLPGSATRVCVKAVGDLFLDDSNNSGVLWKGISAETASYMKDLDLGVPQVSTTTGQRLTEDWDTDMNKEEEIPTVDPLTGEWILSDWDVECIAVGAGILGCGGGGSPHIGKLITLRRLKEGNKIKIITPERASSMMRDNEVSLSVGMMGAPTIVIERLLRSEIKLAVDGVSDLFAIGQYNNGDICNKDGVEIVHGNGISYIDDYQPPKCDKPKKNVKKIVSIFSAEIGGMNSMTPLFPASLLDLPVVDCDCMGRAFPELQHNSSMIYGHPPYPACLADYKGRRLVVLHVDSPKALENHCRNVCIEMGCAAGLSLAPLSKNEIWDPVSGGKVIPHSISRAWRLGNAVWQARKAKTNTIKAILAHESGKLLFIGKISDVQRKIEGGFARGEMKLDGIDTFSEQRMVILFQNENLVAKSVTKDRNLQVVACVPDLISLVDHDLGEPIPTEEVRYGLRVAVLAIPAHPLLTTPQALRVVGPQAFGYQIEEVRYEPCGQYVAHDPIPLK